MITNLCFFFFSALNPDYGDGISSPRKSHTGGSLPSARNVSLTVHRPSYAIDPDFTMMTAVFGQFLDHDITATALNQGQDNEPIDCCIENTELHPECFPVILGPGDPNFDLYNITCMNFIRSAPAPTEHFGPRQQLNQASAYIDGSVIYGYTADKMHNLRTREFLFGFRGKSIDLLFGKITNCPIDFKTRAVCSECT